jgi:hypothetical protein
MARIVKFSAKCSDLFCAELIIDGIQIGSDYSGYVPDFFPGQHYGDYVLLEVDVDTGKIVNWKVPPQEEVDHVFGVDCKE